MAKSTFSFMEDFVPDKIREELNKKVLSAVQSSNKYTSAEKKQIAANLSADERDKPKFSEEARIQEEARRRIEEERLRREREFRQLQEERNRQYQADLAARSTPEATEQRDYQYTYGANTVLGKISANTQGKQGVNADAAQQSADSAVQDIRTGTDALSREVYGIQQPETVIKSEQNLIQHSAFDISRSASDAAKQKRQNEQRTKLAQGTAILDMLNEAMKSARGDQRADISKQIAGVRSANMQAARDLGAIYNSASGRYELMNGQVIQPESIVDPVQVLSTLNAGGAGTALALEGRKRTVANSIAKSTEQILSSGLGAVQDAANSVSGEFYSALGSVLRGIGQEKLADAADAQAEYSFSADLFGADRWRESIEKRYPWEETGVEKVASMLNEGAGYMLPSIAAGLLSGGSSIGSQLGSNASAFVRSAAGGGNAGLATMAASVYGSGTKEALDEGASLAQARTYGALSAIASSGTEKLAGGIPGLNSGFADDFVQKMLRSPKLQRGAGIAVDLLGEGAEEAIEAVLDPVWRRITFDPNAQMATPEQLAESFGAGVLLSAVLMGGNYTGNKIAEKVTDRELGIRTVSDRKYKQIMKQIQPDYNTYDRLVGAGFTESEIAETSVYTAVERGELGLEDAEGMLREIRSNAAVQTAENGVRVEEVETDKTQANNYLDEYDRRFGTVSQEDARQGGISAQAAQESVLQAEAGTDTERINDAVQTAEAENNAAVEEAASIDPQRTELNREQYQARLMQAMRDTVITSEQANNYLDEYDRRFGTVSQEDARQGDISAQAAQESVLQVPEGNDMAQVNGAVQTVEAENSAAVEEAASIDPQRTELNREQYQARLMQAMRDTVITSEQANNYLDEYDRRFGIVSREDARQGDISAQAAQESVLQAEVGIDTERINDFVRRSEMEISATLEEGTFPSEIVHARELLERMRSQMSDTEYQVILRNIDTIKAQVQPTRENANRLRARLENVQNFDDFQNALNQDDLERYSPEDMETMQRISDQRARAKSYFDEGVAALDDYFPSNHRSPQTVQRLERLHEALKRFQMDMMDESNPVYVAEQYKNRKFEFFADDPLKTDTAGMIEINDRIYALRQSLDDIISIYRRDNRMLTQEDSELLDRMVRIGRPELAWANDQRYLSDNFEMLLELYPYKRAIMLCEMPLNAYRKTMMDANWKQASYFTKHLDYTLDMTGFSYARLTPKRIIEKLFDHNQTVGDKIFQTYFYPLDQHEAEGIRLREAYAERVRKFKLNAHESVAVHMLLDENFEAYAEYYSKYKSHINESKCKRVVPEFRLIFEDIHFQINQSLVAAGYPTIGKIGNYAPHFEKPEGLLRRTLAKMGRFIPGRHFIGSDDVGTSLSGLTHVFRPGKRFSPHALRREGVHTDYDILYGFDGYMDTMIDVVTLTSDTRRLRAFEDVVRYRIADELVQQQVDEIMNNNSLDILQKLELVDNAYASVQSDQSNVNVAIRGGMEVFQNKGLDNFAMWLRDYTNHVAGKKTFIDRPFEHLLGRDMYEAASKGYSRIAANLATTFSASATNFSPIMQAALGECGPVHVLAAIKDTIRGSLVSDDGFVFRSDFLTTRRGSERLKRGKVEIALDAVSLVDDLSTEIVTRAMYLKSMKNGNSDPMRDADEYARSLIGDRSKTGTPMIFNSNNPLFKAIAMFQLEVNNQYSYLWHDLRKRCGGAATLAYLRNFAGIMVANHLFNMLHESVWGYSPLLDPIEWIKELFDYGEEDDEKDAVLENLQELTKNILDQTPFLSTVSGGGRIPTASVIPGGSFEGLLSWLEDINNEKIPADQRLNRFVTELMRPTMLLLPAFGNQLRKTLTGLTTMIRGGVYRYDEDWSRVLSAPVDDDNSFAWIQAIAAGFSGNADVRATFDGAPALTEWQTSVFDSIRNGEQDYGISAYEFAKLAQSYNAMKNRIDAQGQEIKGSKLYDFRKQIAEMDISDDNKRRLDAAIIGQMQSYMVDYGATSERFEVIRSGVYDKSLPKEEQDAALYLASVCNSVDYFAMVDAQNSGVRYSKLKEAYDSTDGLQKQTQMNLISKNPKQQIEIFSSQQMKAQALFELDGLSVREKEIYAEHMLGNLGQILDFSDEIEFYKTLLLSSSQQEAFDAYDRSVIEPEEIFLAKQALDAYMDSFKQVHDGWYESKDKFYSYDGYQRTIINAMDYTDEQKAAIDSVLFDSTFGVKYPYIQSETITYEKFNDAWQVMYGKGEDGKDKFKGKDAQIQAIMDYTDLDYADAALIYSIKYKSVEDLEQNGIGSSSSQSSYRGRRNYSGRRYYRRSSGGSSRGSSGSVGGLSARKFSKPYRNGYKIASLLKDYSYSGLFHF